MMLLPSLLTLWSGCSTRVKPSSSIALAREVEQASREHRIDTETESLVYEELHLEPHALDTTTRPLASPLTPNIRQLKRWQLRKHRQHVQTQEQDTTVRRHSTTTTRPTPRAHRSLWHYVLGGLLGLVLGASIHAFIYRNYKKQ